MRDCENSTIHTSHGEAPESEKRYSPGEPGDTVVIWPAKGAPLVARRLARCAPYDKFYFADLSDGRTVTLPVNKVRLIHTVIGGTGCAQDADAHYKRS